MVNFLKRNEQVASWAALVDLGIIKIVRPHEQGKKASLAMIVNTCYLQKVRFQTDN